MIQKSIHMVVIREVYWRMGASHYNMLTRVYQFPAAGLKCSTKLCLFVCFEFESSCQLSFSSTQLQSCCQCLMRRAQPISGRECPSLWGSTRTQSEHSWESEVHNLADEAWRLMGHTTGGLTIQSGECILRCDVRRFAGRFAWPGGSVPRCDTLEAGCAPLPHSARLVDGLRG